MRLQSDENRRRMYGRDLSLIEHQNKLRDSENRANDLEKELAELIDRLKGMWDDLKMQIAQSDDKYRKLEIENWRLRAELKGYEDRESRR